MASRSNESAKAQETDDDLPIRGARLEPIGVVERELVSPDGTRLKVEVPVYPPFRLETQPPRRPPARSATGRRKKPKEKAAPDES